MKTHGIVQGKTKNGLAETFFVFALIAVLLYLFHFVFWNKYIGIQDGWGNVYSVYIEQGKVPYRDFYLFAQPLSVLLSTAITHVFGNTVIALRVWGLLERVLITFFLFLIFRRLVNASHALLLAVTAVVFATGTYIDLVYEYGQTCILLIIISTWLVSNYLVLYQQGNMKSARKYLLAGGLFGGLAFITKQSIGLIAPVTIIIFLLVFESGTKRKIAATAAFCYALMFSLPMLLTLGILYHLGAAQPYLNQVFASAAESKGGLFSLLFGAITRYYFLLLHGELVALVFLGLFILNKRYFTKKSAAHTAEKNNYLLPALLIIFSVLAGFMGVDYFKEYQVEIFFFANKHFMLLVVYATCIMLTLFLYFRLFSARLPADEWQWFFLAMVGASVIYSQGLSSDYDVRSCALAMAVTLGMLYSLAIYPKFKNSLLNIYCICVIAGTLVQHYVFPYNWWGWVAPSISYSTTSSPLKPLKGLKMSAYTSYVFSNITDIIRQNVRADETIYEFPHMPLLYVLANRYPSTWAVTDYMDVCSDQCAEVDAARLIKQPPKVLVIESFPEATWQYHEYIFRNGHRSGQRDIANALDELVQRYAYNRVASFPSGIAGYTINVWVRKGLGKDNG